MPEKLQQILASLGLDLIQAQIYWQIYSNPKASVSDLANELGTYRKKIYEGLSALEKIGLLEKIEGNGLNKTKSSVQNLPFANSTNSTSSKVEQRKIEPKIKYQAKSPAIIQTLLKAKQHEASKFLLDFEDILPSLQTKFWESKVKSEVRIFNGENKFKYLLNTILLETEDYTEFLCFNEGEDLLNLFDADYFFQVWSPRRIAKNCFARILANGQNPKHNLTQKTAQQKLRQVKSLPNNRHDLGAFWLIGSKVIFWDTTQIKAILIENESVAKILANMFEITWDNLEK